MITNPESIYQNSLHPLRETVWSAKIFESYCFENDERNAIIVIKNRYRAMIIDFWDLNAKEREMFLAYNSN